MHSINECRQDGGLFFRKQIRNTCILRTFGFVMSFFLKALALCCILSGKSTAVAPVVGTKPVRWNY